MFMASFNIVEARFPANLTFHCCVDFGQLYCSKTNKVLALIG